MIEILLSAAYASLFIWFIRKWSFFKTEGVSADWFVFAFLLKIIAGISLWAIYTFYYTDRSLADIYKYFDDSRIMFGALQNEPKDFLKMITGIGIDDSFRGKYFDHMNNWYRQFTSNFLNDNQTIIRFNALMRFISMGYYQVHSVFVCFLSFIGLTAIYQLFLPYFKDRARGLFFCLFLFPSVVFWSSGVLKEGFLFFSLGLFLWTLKKAETGKFTVGLVASLIPLLGLMLILKLYVFIALMPALAGLFFLRIPRVPNNTTTIVFMFIGWVFVFFTGFGLTSYFPLETKPLEAIAQKQKNFMASGKGQTMLLKRDTLFFFDESNRACLIPEQDSLHFRMAKGCDLISFSRFARLDTTFYKNQDDTTACEVVFNYKPSNSYFDIPRLDGKPASFFKAIPEACFNAFFRPFPWDIHAALVVFPAFENLLLATLILLLIFFHRKPGNGFHWVMAGFSFCFVLFVIIGMTTPVMGALVRYKVPGLPFLLVFILFLYDKEKMLIRFPFLKRFF